LRPGNSIKERRSKGSRIERQKQAKVVRYVRSVIGWPLLWWSSGVFGFSNIRWRTHKLCDGFAVTTFAHLPNGLARTRRNSGEILEGSGLDRPDFSPQSGYFGAIAT